MTDAESIVDRAIPVYVGMRSQPQLASVLEAGTCVFEVPVSFCAAEVPGRVVRGVIDCLAQMPGGEVVVVDFKTGTARDTDQQQLDLYIGAVRHLCPGQQVRGFVVYPV